MATGHYKALRVDGVTDMDAHMRPGHPDEDAGDTVAQAGCSADVAGSCPAGATQLPPATQLATQAVQAQPEVFFLVSGATSNVCVMESADCTKPLGLKLPLQRLQPTSSTETADIVTKRLLLSLQARTATEPCDSALLGAAC